MDLSPNMVGLRKGSRDEYDEVSVVHILTPLGEIGVRYNEDVPFREGPEILIDCSILEIEVLDSIAVLDGYGNVWHLEKRS